MKFGVREICDVTFKATTNGQKLGAKTFNKYQPVFMIDTARTSNFEQASTTVYAQGGRGYARLIAWEGEKTMTFTVEDALISPMGLAVLSGAGLIKASDDNNAKVHTTVQTTINAEGKVEITLADLREETGLTTATKFTICHKIPMYATTFVNDGGDSGFYEINTPEEAIDVTEDSPAELTVKDYEGTGGTTVVVDFYLTMANSVTTVEIKPEDFGGFFYVEAQTLFRDEATGKDMAANLTFPKVKIQSGFTFTMAASGDPSTFTFTMDAFPGYAICKPEKKTMVDIQIINHAESDEEDNLDCNCGKADTPSFKDAIHVKNSKAVGTDHIPAGVSFADEYEINQGKANVVVNGDKIAVTVTGGVDSLEEWTSTDPGQALLGDKPWIALDIDTGTKDITQFKYNGYQLTETDVEDAAAWGLDAGHFILWIKADEVKEAPKTFTLSGEGFDTTTVTITVADAA